MSKKIFLALALLLFGCSKASAPGLAERAALRYERMEAAGISDPMLSKFTHGELVAFFQRGIESGDSAIIQSYVDGR